MKLSLLRIAVRSRAFGPATFCGLLPIFACDGAPSASTVDGGGEAATAPEDTTDASNPTEDGASSPTEDGASYRAPDAASDAVSVPMDAAAAAINYAVWGFGPTDVWIGDDTGTMTHWDGMHYHALTTGTEASVRSIWGASTSDVWAAAEYEMLHWDGVHLSAVAVPNQSKFVTSVHGSSATDVWAVGLGGVALHWDGRAWTSYPTGLDISGDLYGVWVRSPTEAYAVGGFVDPIAIRWNGTAWTPFTTAGLASGISSVWGAASNDLWGAIESGGVAHYRGGQWMVAPAPVSGRPINQVWGSGASDVWTAGGFAGSGEAFHYDGSRWSAVNVGASGSLRGVWSAGGAGNTWFVGDDGAIVRR
jgi:hypothetical protein